MESIISDLRKVNFENDPPTIVLDFGHGYVTSQKGEPIYDSGAIFESEGKIYKEAVLVRQIGYKLKDELEEKGYNVIVTTSDNDKNQKAMETRFQERIDKALDNNADIYLSLHINSYDYNEGDKNPFFLIYHHEDAYDESKSLAKNFNLELNGDDINGVRKTRSSVINVLTYYSDKKGYDIYRGLGGIPAVLMEIGNVQNPNDRERIIKDGAELAQQIADGLDNILSKPDSEKNLKIGTRNNTNKGRG